MEKKETKKTYSFKVSESLLTKVQKKIDQENLKVKDRQERTNMSRKMTELLYDYISR
jgi:hypothetical protein